MKYDVICVGGAAIDTFLKSTSKDMEIENIHKHADVCLPIGAKILMSEIHTEVGGAAVNTSISLSRLGLKTAVICKLGDDISAQTIIDKLKKEKVKFLGKIARGITGQSTILTGLQNDRTILTYKGNSNKLLPKDLPAKINTKWLYFGTLMEQGWKTQCKLAKYAKKKKINILFNPSLYLAEKGEKYLKPILEATTILILNKEEAQALTRTTKNVKELLKILQKKCPIIVITDGPKGAYAYDGDKTYYIFPKQVKVIDPTGAGDSFASAFLAAIIHGKNISKALEWGAAQANSIIQHYGATNILLTKKQIENQSRKSGKTKEV